MSDTETMLIIVSDFKSKFISINIGVISIAIMSSIFPKTYVIVMIFPVISCFPANCQVWKEKRKRP